MKDRIKAVRNALKLTQTEFGEHLSVKGNTLTNYETGLRNPSEAVITLLVARYHVNETWLRTGDGEMFVQPTRDEAIAAFVGSALSDEDEGFKRRLLSVLSRLDEKEWQLLEKMAKKLAGE